MILCVTLNPCLDKTLIVPPWEPGDSVRGVAVREVVGGKGNNVARALCRLGRVARPVTFLGGTVGAACERRLRVDDALDPVVIPVEACTREILTVRTQDTPRQTAFFDPDPVITAAEADSLHQRVADTMAAGTVEMLTLSGSSPCKTTDTLFNDLIALARRQRIPVFLDTYGPALESIWGFWPEAIQLNRREASTRLGRSAEQVSEEDLFGLLEDWARHGIQLGVITDGGKPVLVYMDGGFARVRPPAVEVVNPIGSGDCLLAGMADAWLAKQPQEEVIRRGMACAVANTLTWDAGAIEPEVLPGLMEQITVERLERRPRASSTRGLEQRRLGD